MCPIKWFTGIKGLLTAKLKVFAASITERFNLSSFLKFYKKCFDFGIKPIIGCEVFIECFFYEQTKILILSQ